MGAVLLAVTKLVECYKRSVLVILEQARPQCTYPPLCTWFDKCSAPRLQRILCSIGVLSVAIDSMNSASTLGNLCIGWKTAVAQSAATRCQRYGFQAPELLKSLPLRAIISDRCSMQARRGWEFGAKHEITAINQRKPTQDAAQCRLDFEDASGMWGSTYGKALNFMCKNIFSRSNGNDCEDGSRAWPFLAGAYALGASDSSI